MASFVAMLRQQRFGVSGSGKSSLLRAGLIPEICTNGRVSSDAVDGDDGEYLPVLVTPGAEPRTALRRVVEQTPSGRDGLLGGAKTRHRGLTCASGPLQVRTR